MVGRAAVLSCTVNYPPRAKKYLCAPCFWMTPPFLNNNIVVCIMSCPKLAGNHQVHLLIFIKVNQSILNASLSDSTSYQVWMWLNPVRQQWESFRSETSNNCCLLFLLFTSRQLQTVVAHQCVSTKVRETQLKHGGELYILNRLIQLLLHCTTVTTRCMSHHEAPLCSTRTFCFAKSF